MTFNSSQPYNELPYLPPKTVLESIEILKACIPARTALAELKQAGELLPNQGLLINALPLLEAKDSSEIENIVTTTDKLFKFSQEDTHADSATKDALQYRTAQLTFHKINAIRQLIDNTIEFIRHEAPKIYSYELVNVIFEQPYRRIQNLIETGLARRQTASTYLKKLCEIGVLQEVSAGKEKLFVHPKLMQLLTNDKNQFKEYHYSS